MLVHLELKRAQERAKLLRPLEPRLRTEQGYFCHVLLAEASHMASLDSGWREINYL